MASQLIRSTRVIAGLTMASRVLGLARDVLCAAVFPPAVWHYFVLAFTLPNLFRRLFGEGALSAALIPVYTELRERDVRAARDLASSVVTLTTMLLSALTLVGLGVLWAWSSWGEPDARGRLILSLAAIMLPYLVFICLVGVLGGLLNSHRRFAAPAAAPILLNLCIIVAAWWGRGWFGESPWRQIYAVAWAVLLAGVVQLALQWPALRAAGVGLRLRWSMREPEIRRLLRLMLPMVIGLGAMQLNAYLDYLIAHFLSATPEKGATFELFGRVIAYPVAEGSVSYLYFAQRLYHLPLGVFGIALATAIFPELSRRAARQDGAGFASMLGQGVRLAIFIAVGSAAGLILIRTELVQVLFERGRFGPEDTPYVAWTLLCYAVGIPAYFLQQVLVRAFYSLQDPVTPVKTAVRVIVVNVVLNVTLIWWFGVGGLALSTALCSGIQVAWLVVLLRRRHGIRVQGGIGPAVGKVALAAGAMVGAYLLLWAWGPGAAWLRVAVSVPVCGGVYVATAWLTGMGEIRALLHRGPRKPKVDKGAEAEEGSRCGSVR